ncbi:hypothetical protein SHKM778_10420 [Streptomyces sp. KM77-8]|uniref:Uncharacterized protein n=1 Tax=Streptomyces haneummycinicus TaxID=3074435 RepID=A0AAT9HB72_9ACTN
MLSGALGPVSSSTVPGRPAERNPMSTTTTAVDASLPDSWEELVTTALLGTDRRTPAGSAPGPDAPSALLDAAAAATVRRRAGLRPGRSVRRPEPAPGIRAPHCLRPPRAGSRCCWPTVPARPA